MDALFSMEVAPINATNLINFSLTSSRSFFLSTSRALHVDRKAHRAAYALPQTDAAAPPTTAVRFSRLEFLRGAVGIALEAR